MTKQEIEQYKEQGLTYQQIGDKFGVSRQRICQVLKGRKPISDYTRRVVIRKNNNICQWRNKCDGNNYISYLEIHHIDLDPSNNNIENLTVLCKKCHAEFHRLNKENLCDICHDNTYPLTMNAPHIKKNICTDCWKKMVKEKKERWSNNFDKCTECGTTKIKHIGGGLCSTCYWRNRYNNDELYRKKRLQVSIKWRNKNKDSVARQQKQYRLSKQK